MNERLENNIEMVIFRVLQECINNIIKHANANEVNIQMLIRQKNKLSISIEDNGKGFNTGNAVTFEGIGLKNIYSRIAFLKGTVNIDSQIGKGTAVYIEVPI